MGEQGKRKTGIGCPTAGVVLAALTLMAVVVAPRLLLARGGVYPSTGHGNTGTGVYRLPEIPRGDCSHCHNEHASMGGNPTGGPYPYLLFTFNTNDLCAACHSTPGKSLIYRGLPAYNDSSHGRSGFMAWPGPVPPARPTSDAGKCVNCHSPHGYRDAQGLVPNLAYLREEALCNACHGGYPARKNILIQFGKPYAHPVATSGKHSVSEGGDPSRYGATPVNNRHSECEDCHNPHYGKPDLLLVPPNAPSILQAVGRVKVTNNVPGVAPTYQYAGPDDTTFPNEYETCFKCHSSWTSLLPGKSDLAVLFNPGNPSYHPVEAAGKNRINDNSFVQGLVKTWGSASLVYCTDCHSSDDPDVRGPHGSIYPYILKKSYNTVSTRWTMTPTDLCFDCHQYDTYSNVTSPDATKAYSRFNPPATIQGHTFHVGTQGYACYACHNSHGSAVNPALIVTMTRNPGISAYSQTSTGGSCTPTCHGTKTYSINYPR